MRSASVRIHFILSVGLFSALLPQGTRAAIEDSTVAAPVPMISASQARDTRVPLYQTLRPSWGIELTGGLSSSFGFQGGGLRFEWQPPWIQAAGVFSIGAALDYTMGILGGGVGGVVRYQARYFREQPVVPMAGYTMLGYFALPSLSGGFAGLTTAMVHGPFVGGYILLNFFESDGAAEFYVDYGVLRSYLVAEVRFMQGAPTTGVTLSSPSYYMGLRFEF